MQHAMDTFHRVLLFPILFCNSDLVTSVHIKHHLLCKECIYSSKKPKAQNALKVQMTSFKGVGRTGNIVTSIKKAFHYAQICRGYLQLPKMHIALDYGSAGTSYDFSWLQLNRSQGTTCTSLKGSSRLFWNLEMDGSPIASECIRAYLGICNENFCAGLDYIYRSNILVAHVRQGDIFPPKFSRWGFHKSSGQPPWSYYLAAIQMVRPETVIFLGEPTKDQLSPIWLAARRLEKYQAMKSNFIFQSTSFEHDIKTLLCAYNVIESHSTLDHVISLGFSNTVFSSSCRVQPYATVYQIDFPKNHFFMHTNSREEWIDILLTDAGNVSMCSNHPDLSAIHGVTTSNTLSRLFCSWLWC